MTNGMIDEKWAIAWIGNASWIDSPGAVIYNTRQQARNAGWKNPCKVRIALIEPKS
jgi:hypothetical protein